MSLCIKCRGASSWITVHSDMVDPLLPDVRNLRSQIISHYLAFDYADVAEAAIRVKPEEANAVLDEEAELELAALQKRTAERELAEDQRARHHDERDETDARFGTPPVVP